MKMLNLTTYLLRVRERLPKELLTLAAVFFHGAPNGHVCCGQGFLTNPQVHTVKAVNLSAFSSWVRVARVHLERG